jgi:hypothetical protein
MNPINQVNQINQINQIPDSSPSLIQALES